MEEERRKYVEIIIQWNDHLRELVESQGFDPENKRRL